MLKKAQNEQEQGLLFVVWYHSLDKEVMPLRHSFLNEL